MMTRTTVVGLVVLGLVAAGVYWARSHSATEAGPSPVPASPRASGDEAWPDVTLADGSVDAGNLRITLSLSPRPPVAFEKTRVRVAIRSNVAGSPGGSDAAAGPPLAFEGGRIIFEMSMPMGDHRYSLVPAPDGWHEAEVVLPACPSGMRRWYATVEGVAGGRSRAARFRFDLARPASSHEP